MTCPHHFELYLSKPRSYRELPMRIAEFAQLYRYEQSGELMGLQRVRSMCLSDAHIICASEEQAVEEAGKSLDLIEYLAGIFGLKLGVDYRYRLSLGDRVNTKKYYKNDAAWEKSEALLRNLLKGRVGEFEEAKDEAAFYGPKIDIQMKNANDKEDTAFTVQYDFCMPDRFDLTYTGTGGEKKRCFVIHRSSIGTLERAMAFLIEKYEGAFPVWLSPVQVALIPISEKHSEHAKKVAQILQKQNVRFEIMDENETLGKKIREAEMQKIPYLLVVGDKEMQSNTVSVRQRGKGDLGAISLEKFIDKIKKEIEDKK